jgi:hypothetical protein
MIAGSAPRSDRKPDALAASGLLAGDAKKKRTPGAIMRRGLIYVYNRRAGANGSGKKGFPVNENAKDFP